MEDRALRRNIILAKIEDRRLPHDTIPRVLGGPGMGEACDGCDEAISKAEYVMEGVLLAASPRDDQR